MSNEQFPTTPILRRGGTVLFIYRDIKMVAIQKGYKMVGLSTKGKYGIKAMFELASH
jgi:hypothetical protein